jgi:hypothetical protein
MPKTALDLLDEKISALEEKLTTCNGEECKRLDSVLEALKEQAEVQAAAAERIEKLEASLAAKTKEAVDGRLEPFAAKFGELSGAYDNLSKNVSKPAIPADAYFTCADCGSPLLVTKDTCPNDQCKAPVDWDATLADVRGQREAEAAKE